MPTYDYACPKCGPFEIFIPLADYDEFKDGFTCNRCDEHQAVKMASSPGFTLKGRGFASPGTAKRKVG